MSAIAPSSAAAITTSQAGSAPPPGMPPLPPGGGASDGASALKPVLEALTQVTAALSELVAAMQQRQTIGGGPGAPGCSCSSGGGGSADPVQQSGSAGAPEPVSTYTAPAPAPPAPEPKPKTGPGDSKTPAQASASPTKQPGETSYNALTPAALRTLDVAHGYGLKLISGLRSGEKQGHGNGSAVDVANVPGGSRQDSPEMKAYAEAMRAAGKAGDPNVGYVIYQQKIASASSGWEWKQMEDRGSNTQNHFDHVHVSTDPKR